MEEMRRTLRGQTLVINEAAGNAARADDSINMVDEDVTESSLEGIN